MAFSVVTALDEYVASLEVERKPDGTWHPSSISGCPRKALYEFRGVTKSNPHDARTSRVFRVGHLLHEFIQEAISHSPDVEEVYSEVRLEHPDFRTSGHADGLVRYKNGTWEALEFKTINSMAFRYGDLPKEDHKIQGAIYLKAMREAGCWAMKALPDGEPYEVKIPPLLGNLTKIRFVYVSKDDLRVEEFTMLWTEAKNRELIDRYSLLERHLADGTVPDRLPPMEKKGQLVRDYRCGYCPFLDTCWGEE